MASCEARFPGAGCRRFAVPAMLVACGGAMAEPDAIDTCREASTDAARIACLEDALRRGDEPGEVESGETASPPEPAASHAPPQVATQETAPSAPEAAAADIGAEQVRARHESREEREARRESASGLAVAAYTTVPYRRLQVELENGQVWRQVKGDTQHIRVDLERNQTVDIDETGLGGYKLRLNEIRRIIAVERIR